MFLREYKRKTSVIIKLVGAIFSPTCNIANFNDNIRMYSLLEVDTKSILMYAPKVQSGGDPRRPLLSFFWSGDWDQLTTQPQEHPIIKNSIDFVLNDFNWSCTNEEQRLINKIKLSEYADGCKNYHDVKIRLKRQREIAIQMARDRLLLNRKSLSIFSFREFGGIEVAIGRNGRVIKVGDGQHRFGFALALGIEKIPVCVIGVHSQYRKSNK